MVNSHKHRWHWEMSCWPGRKWQVSVLFLKEGTRGHSSSYFVCCSFQWEQSREAARGGGWGWAGGQGRKWHKVTSFCRAPISLVLFPISAPFSHFQIVVGLQRKETRQEALFQDSHPWPVFALVVLAQTLFSGLTFYSFLSLNDQFNLGYFRCWESQFHCPARFIHLEVGL